MGQTFGIFSADREPISACDLVDQTRSIKGIAQNGKSSSDSWLLKMDPTLISPRNQEGKVQEYNVFLKYFLEYDTLIKYFINKKADEYKDNFIPMFADEKTGEVSPEYRKLKYTIMDSSNLNTLALEYESRVYSLITKPMLTNLISPFFIDTVNTSTTCTFDVLENLTRRTGIDKNNLLRNIAYFLLGIPNRPAIEDSQDISEEDVEDTPGDFSVETVKGLMKYIDYVKDELKFGFIINRAISPGTVNMYNVIKHHGTIYTDSRRTVLSQWFIDVFFQLSTVLYVMKCGGFRHNDLHGENIWVERLDTPRRLDMIYNRKRYSINTRYILKIFDYDFSSVSYLKPNNKAKASYKDIPGEKDGDSPIISQLGTLFDFIIFQERNLDKTALNIPLGRLISASGNLNGEDGVVYTLFGTGKQRPKYTLESKTQWMYIAPIETIMDRLYKIHPGKIDNFKPERVYIADPEIFNKTPPSDKDYSKSSYINTDVLNKIRSEVVVMVGNTKMTK